MHKLGYDMLLLDDCWSATERNASGHLQPNAKQFPSGMKYLVDKVHELGLRIVRRRRLRNGARAPPLPCLTRSEQGLYTCIGTETCRGGRPGSFGYYDKDAAVSLAPPV